MTQNFASTALKLCAVSARVLGWRPAEFWAATPAELATALGLLNADATCDGFDRQTLQRLMDHDDDR